MQPLRILHIVTKMGHGGLEAMLMNYYKHIDREKIQFDFLVHRTSEGDYDAEIRSLGGQIYYVNKLNPFSASYYKSLYAFFKTHHYDIVHCHLDCMSFYPLMIAKKCGVKTRIAHAHSASQDKNIKYLIKMPSKKLIHFAATDLFACGQKAGEFMFSPNKFTVLNNAIDVESYSFNPDTALKKRRELSLSNEFVVGHVGRFSPPKNHLFLIDIFADIHKTEQNSVLVMVGTGVTQEKIREKVNSLNLQDSVLFLNNRRDVNELLQVMDVMVFPSLYEGVSLALVEAQASGLPCILSDTISSECKMIEETEFLSLNDDIEKWTEHAIRFKNHKKENQIKSIRDAGYDVQINANWLQNFYLSRSSNE